jgi:DNA-binding NarL/FixJ family response regulator
MNIENLLKKYQETVDSLIVDPESVNYSILTHHIELMERIAIGENSSVTIMDLLQKKYIFIRNRFKDIISYDEKKASEQGYSYFFNLMHPDDLPMVIDTSTKSVEFLRTVSADDRKDYKTVFEFRLRDGMGQYIRFIQQIAVLELDLKGNIWLILILMDLSPNQQESKTFQRSMINLKNRKVYMFGDDSSSGNAQLSTRELEILGLLAKGMVSKEIAGRLFISVNTVNNHRQKIIEKMDVYNTTEALSYAEKIGII